MGEPVLEADVAGREDPRIARPQEVIDADARPGAVIDPGRIEAQVLDVGHAAGAGEDLVDRHRAPVVVGDQVDLLLAGLDPHPDDPGVEPDLEAVAGERIRQDLRRIALLSGQEQRELLGDRGRDAEPAERLGELAAQRPAADHEQPSRQLGQLEDALVGQVAGLVEARQRGSIRPRSGRDHRLVEAELGAVDGQPVARDEPRVAMEHLDAEVGQAVDRSGSGEPGADLVQALHRRHGVGGDRGRGTRPVARGVLHLGVHPRGAQERLRRDAAGVQGRTPQELALDQRHPDSQRRGRARRDQAGRAAPDDDQIVAARRRHSQPPRNPARRSPVTSGGQPRISRHGRPVR